MVILNIRWGFDGFASRLPDRQRLFPVFKSSNNDTYCKLAIAPTQSVEILIPCAEDNSVHLDLATITQLQGKVGVAPSLYQLHKPLVILLQVNGTTPSTDLVVEDAIVIPFLVESTCGRYLIAARKVSDGMARVLVRSISLW